MSNRKLNLNNLREGKGMASECKATALKILILQGMEEYKGAMRKTVDSITSIFLI